MNLKFQCFLIIFTLVFSNYSTFASSSSKGQIYCNEVLVNSSSSSTSCDFANNVQNNFCYKGNLKSIIKDIINKKYNWLNFNFHTPQVINKYFLSFFINEKEKDILSRIAIPKCI
jgi:hypothetical protein